MGIVDLKVVIWKIGGGKGDRLVMMVISGGWCVAIETDGLWLIAMDGVRSGRYMRHCSITKGKLQIRV